MVSVIIPNYCNPEKLENCIRSIENSSYSLKEIIVVDDPCIGVHASSLLHLGMINVVQNKVEYFVAGCRNIGYYESRGEFLFFLDSDNIIEENAISKMIQIMKQYPSIGILAPVAFYFSDKGKLWKAGDYKSKVFRINKNYKVSNLEPGLFYIENMANSFVVRRAALEITGPFDNVNFPRDESEPDMYIRMRVKGFETLLLNTAITYHDIGMEKLTHLDANRIQESFKSRIWIDRKHKFKGLNLVGVTLIVTSAYYCLLILIKKDLNRFFVKFLKSMLVGLFMGFYGKPHNTPQLSNAKNSQG